MTIDLAQFHEAFFEESFEALDAMEAALLKLDVGAPDPELINTIFRVAHSIKGGSATFGFADIASFTHSLETLLDELRGGGMAASAAVSDLLLKSVDVLRAMLRAVQSKQPIDSQRVSDLQFDLEVAIANKSRAPDADAPRRATPARADSSTAPDSAAAPDAAAPPGPLIRERALAAPPPAGGARWRIQFRPFREFLARGNDPARILRELAKLGSLETQVDAGRLPELLELRPQDCHLAWTLTLSGEASEDSIRQVFEWAEGDCELTLEREPPAACAAPATAPATPPRAEPPGKPESPAAGGSDSGSIRVSVEKIDDLMNTVGELVITQSMLGQLIAHWTGADAEKLRAGLAQLERNMRELQDTVMRVRMLPISFVFSRFPRMVRDLAQRLGKQVELKLTGEQTELDKTVLEKIGDPLMHLVRNCIDHGIELPEVRAAAGKPATGTVHLDACHRGGNIAVEVLDDGGGLDHERILARARAQGLVGAAESLSEPQIHELIFVPGFSTVEKTTDVSGRGVGMDVVRRNIKQLGGSVEVSSEPGRGSRFRITLPLTLAIVDGQSVSVGRETYIVPLVSIVESMRLGGGGLGRLSGRGEVFSFRGEYLPIVRLHELFAVEPRSRALGDGLVVVAEGDGRRVGLFVDDLLGQQQVVIKSLETNYGHIDGVSGATILGDGSVALILDVPGIIRAAGMRAAA